MSSIVISLGLTFIIFHICMKIIQAFTRTITTEEIKKEYKREKIQEKPKEIKKDIVLSNEDFIKF